jgi:hypothetical protein
VPTTAAEDAVAPWADQASGDDQDEAEKDLTLKKLNDSYNDQDYSHDP